MLQRRTCDTVLSKSFPQSSGTSGHPRSPPGTSASGSSSHLHFSPADQPGPSVHWTSPDVPVRFPTIRCSPQLHHKPRRAALWFPTHSVPGSPPLPAQQALGKSLSLLRLHFFSREMGVIATSALGEWTSEGPSPEHRAVARRCCSTEDASPHPPSKGRRAALSPAPLPGRGSKSRNKVWGQFHSLSAGHCQRRRPPQPLRP